jgi:acyl-CoA thioesterase FadM
MVGCVYRERDVPGRAPNVATFATDQEDSNLVGNIYHSNYGKWQSRMFDRFLFQSEPDYFRQGGRNGEWLTQRSRLDYLRDAMPFDTIETEMRLRELTGNAVRLAFSYFRRDANGGRTKLAHGEQYAVWVKRTAVDGFEPEPIPAVWRSAFLNSEHEPARAGHAGRDTERDFSMHVAS